MKTGSSDPHRRKAAQCRRMARRCNGIKRQLWKKLGRLHEALADRQPGPVIPTPIPVDDSSDHLDQQQGSPS